MLRYIGICFLTLLFVSSCALNSNLMFKDEKNVKTVYQDSIPMQPEESYRLSVNDRFIFQMFPQDGQKLVETLENQNSSQNQRSQLEYTIRQDGKAELPIIGEVYLQGLTIEECEDTLEYHFSKTNKNPFVKIKVVNKRVIVFPGNGGDAQVVSLTNENTSLMEVLALAGGIAERGKANTIKIIRQSETGRDVYQLDLSTIEGLQYADMIVQANDYIYVEPSKQITKGVLKEITPLLSIITSSIAIITIFSKL